MAMKIIEYAKAHPWQTGVIVVVGGLIFIVISGVFSGGDGGSSGGNVSRPSDAEIAANAQIQAAQIAASAQIAQGAQAVQAASVGAGVQMNSDNKAAEIAMRALELEAQTNREAIGLQKGLYEAQIAAQQQANANFFASLGRVQKKKRDDVLQAYVTGQPFYSGTGQGSTANFFNSAGGFLKNFGDAAGSIASLFSDQRLKENIVLVGQDKRGRNVYEWNYKGATARRRGYIAQDLNRNQPELVDMNYNNRGYATLNMRRLANG
jgi:hypothetical protein